MDEKLDEMMLGCITDVDELTVGSEEHERAMKALAALLSARTEMYKSEAEAYNRPVDDAARRQDKKIEIIFRTAGEVVKVVVPILGVAILAKKILTFDADENSPILNKNAWSLLTKLIH